MKDAVHHLRHVQKKIIQENRRELSKEKPEAAVSQNHEVYRPAATEKKMDQNHRTPRILKRIAIF